MTRKEEDDEEDEGEVAQTVVLDEKLVQASTGPAQTWSRDEVERPSDRNLLHSDAHLHHIASDGESSESQQADDEDKIVPEVQIGAADLHDVEAGIKIAPKRTMSSGTGVVDPNLVGWEGQDDPGNPKNWPSRKKWAATLVMSSFTFITPVASSIVAPAFDAIGAEFHVRV